MLSFQNRWFPFLGRCLLTLLPSTPLLGPQSFFNFLSSINPSFISQISLAFNFQSWKSLLFKIVIHLLRLLEAFVAFLFFGHADWLFVLQLLVALVVDSPFQLVHNYLIVGIEFLRKVSFWSYSLMFCQCPDVWAQFINFFQWKLLSYFHFIFFFTPFLIVQVNDSQVFKFQRLFLTFVLKI